MNGIPVSPGRFLQNAPTWRPRWPVFRGLFLAIFPPIPDLLYAINHQSRLALPTPHFYFYIYTPSTPGKVYNITHSLPIYHYTNIQTNEWWSTVK